MLFIAVVPLIGKCKKETFKERILAYKKSTGSKITILPELESSSSQWTMHMLLCHQLPSQMSVEENKNGFLLSKKTTGRKEMGILLKKTIKKYFFEKSIAFLENVC